MFDAKPKASAGPAHLFSSSSLAQSSSSTDDITTSTNSFLVTIHSLTPTIPCARRNATPHWLNIPAMLCAMSPARVAIDALRLPCPRASAPHCARPTAASTPGSEASGRAVAHGDLGAADHIEPGAVGRGLPGASGPAVARADLSRVEPGADGRADK